MTSDVRVGGLAAIAMLASTAAASRPATAEDAMRAHARATSIGRDPCRPGGVSAGDEIVVCGRRGNLYAVPLYAADAAPDAQVGDRRVSQTKDVIDAQGACAMQLAQCRPPAAFNGTKFMSGVMKVVEALTDGE